MIAFVLRVALVSTAMFVGLLVFVEVGRWFGSRRRARLGGGPDDPSGSAIDASVFALFGLLIAFSFSGALDRFDRRRGLIVTEANAIWNAYCRLELLPAASQAELRPLFRQYLASRLAYYPKMYEPEKAKEERDHAHAIQEEIWRQAIAGARTVGTPAVLGIVTSSVSAMSDVEVERIAATHRHPPPVIFGMLLAVGFAAEFLAGHSTSGKPRHWSRVVVFSASLSVAVFVVLNLEYPRLGLIHLGNADLPLIEVLERMR